MKRVNWPPTYGMFWVFLTANAAKAGWHGGGRPLLDELRLSSEPPSPLEMLTSRDIHQVWAERTDSCLLQSGAESRRSSQGRQPQTLRCLLSCDTTGWGWAGLAASAPAVALGELPMVPAPPVQHLLGPSSLHPYQSTPDLATLSPSPQLTLSSSPCLPLQPSSLTIRLTAASLPLLH